MIEIGQPIPKIHFKATNGINTSFDTYKGQWLVLYFYPKDATPGCTLESCDFRDHEKTFSLYNATILGISRDSLSSHEKFKDKLALPFELISDETENLCQLFDVIKMKLMYGKEVRGIERSTFLIDPNGVVRHIWRKLNVKNHVEDVLSVLKNLEHSR